MTGEDSQDASEFEVGCSAALSTGESGLSIRRVLDCGSEAGVVCECGEGHAVLCDDNTSLFLDVLVVLVLELESSDVFEFSSFGLFCSSKTVGSLFTN